jgi:aldehyde dehydrogenase (NAD+)
MIATARYFEHCGGAADEAHEETIPFLKVFLRSPSACRTASRATSSRETTGRRCAPALEMGNAIVMKPAEDACLTPLRLAELAAQAEEAGAALSSHPDVDFLSVTGSPGVGTLIQSAAPLNHIGCTLQFDGKSPHIVFANADLDAAVPVIANTMVQNAGRTCSAGSRVIVERSVFDKVAERLVERFSQHTPGTPEMARDLGPVINATQKRSAA